MKIILIFLFVAFAYTTSGQKLIPDDEKEIIWKCLNKYTPALEAMRKVLDDDLKTCSEIEDPKPCIEAAKAKAHNTISSIMDKVSECVEENKKPVEKHIEPRSNQSSHDKCKEIFQNELQIVKDNLTSDLEKCKTSENEISCALTALENAAKTRTQIIDEMNKCLADDNSSGSTLKEFREGLFSSVNDYKKCFEKFLPKLKEIKRILGEKLQECKANDQPFRCARQAVLESIEAGKAVMDEIHECSATGSK